MQQAQQSYQQGETSGLYADNFLDQSLLSAADYAQEPSVISYQAETMKQAVQAKLRDLINTSMQYQPVEDEIKVKSDKIDLNNERKVTESRLKQQVDQIT